MEPVFWFVLVFLVLLKIPALYLCYVVWWAVKDPPAPGEGFGDASGEPEDGSGPGPSLWWRLRRRRPERPRPGPHGSPARRPAPVVAPSQSAARSKPPVT